VSEQLRIWIEISFNLTYLGIIWWLVIMMIIRRKKLRSEQIQQANILIGAFGLLAFGDTGHVGFRVIAYILGGLKRSLTFLGYQISFVGLGTLMTATTVTFFYVLMLELWKARFHKQYSRFEQIIYLAAAIRLILIIFPANKWYSVIPPQPWSLIRNLPLIFMGLSIAYLIIRDAKTDNDSTFLLIGYMILLSFVCYIPVILFVQRNPMIGMLMIPKTLAYVVIGFLAYNDLYRKNIRQQIQIHQLTTN
jgi:hypothetical protein